VIGNPGEHIGEPSLRIDIIELGSLDQRVHDRGAFAATLGAGEEPGFAAQCNLPFILPISGKKSRSITVGIHSTGAVFGSKAVSSAPVAELSTLRRRRV
jgi:hypothetical protein